MAKMLGAVLQMFFCCLARIARSADILPIATRTTSEIEAVSDLELFHASSFTINRPYVGPADVIVSAR